MGSTTISAQDFPLDTLLNIHQLSNKSLFSFLKTKGFKYAGAASFSEQQSLIFQYPTCDDKIESSKNTLKRTFINKTWKTTFSIHSDKDWYQKIIQDIGKNGYEFQETGTTRNRKFTWKIYENTQYKLTATIQTKGGAYIYYLTIESK